MSFLYRWLGSGTQTEQRKKLGGYMLYGSALGGIILWGFIVWLWMADIDIPTWMLVLFSALFAVVLIISSAIGWLGYRILKHGKSQEELDLEAGKTPKSQKAIKHTNITKNDLR